MNAERPAAILNGATQAVPESAPTDAQRDRVARFVAHLRGSVQPPVYTRYPSGIVRVEVCVPSKAEKDLVDVTGILMNDEGGSAPPKPGDL